MTATTTQLRINIGRRMQKEKLVHAFFVLGSNEGPDYAVDPYQYTLKSIFPSGARVGSLWAFDVIDGSVKTGGKFDSHFDNTEQIAAWELEDRSAYMLSTRNSAGVRKVEPEIDKALKPIADLLRAQRSVAGRAHIVSIVLDKLYGLS